jgi:hypothetical protein
MNEKKTFETVKNVLLNKDISEEEVVDIVREKIPNDIRFRNYKGIEKFMKQYMWNNHFAASYIQSLMTKRLSVNGIKRYENESNTDIANEQREFARKYGEMDEESPSPICTVIQINQPAASSLSIVLEIEKYAKEHTVNLPQAAHHFFRDCKTDAAAYHKFYKLKRKESGKQISNELFRNVLEFLKDPSIDLKEIADLLADELNIDKTFSANNESETLSFIINKIYNKLKPGQLAEVENARNQKIKDLPATSSTDIPKDYVEENKRLRTDLKKALIENMRLKDKLSSTESELERMKRIVYKSRNIYNEICDAYDKLGDTLFNSNSSES